MHQIMTKSKSIVCLNTQIHNVEGKALEWMHEERDLSNQVFLALRVKRTQKMTSLRMLAATFLSLTNNQTNKSIWDFQQALPNCDVQLLLADKDLYEMLINHYDYQQNEKFREYINRQIYKNLSSRRWLDDSNLDKRDYRYDTAYAKEANYSQEEVLSPY